MTQKSRIYDPDFKARAIGLARTSGEVVKTTARNIGIGYSTLAKWIAMTRRTPSSTPTHPPGSSPHPLEEVSSSRDRRSVL